MSGDTDSSTHISITRMIKLDIYNCHGHSSFLLRLTKLIVRPFVYTIVIIAIAPFALWYFIGTHIFPDVLLHIVGQKEIFAFELENLCGCTSIDGHVQRDLFSCDKIPNCRRK